MADRFYLTDIMTFYDGSQSVFVDDLDTNEGFEVAVHVSRVELVSYWVGAASEPLSLCCGEKREAVCKFAVGKVMS